MWLNGAVGILGLNGYELFFSDDQGQVQWKTTLEDLSGGGLAIGDVDGDGVPEAAVVNDGLFLFNADGQLRWSLATHQPDDGNVTLADLDADGRYEIITFGRAGLLIVEGSTGQVLAQRTEIDSWFTLSSAVVADIDGDGSAEIVVIGYTSSGRGEVVRVYGPAHGRWARTRPVWHQEAYDITSITDDGTLLSWPLPSWDAYNTYRAQPAHDGDLPDLTVAATGLCCDETTTFLAIQAENQGSQPALAGATVRLFTHQGTQWVEVASQVLPEVPEQEALEGFIFEIPLDQWGDQQTLQIDGLDARACNRVNDRIPVTLTCD